MFWHNYRYRLKCNLRDRQLLFWTLAFPILLASLFYMAFSNLNSGDQFSKIKLAIVDNEAYRANTPFVTTLSMASKANQGYQLFDLTTTTMEEAALLLEEDRIEGYIHFDPALQLVVKKVGMNQMIIKAFLDDYQQSYATIVTLIEENPEVVKDSLFMSVANRANYIQEIAVGKSNPNSIVIYFYTLMAMACLFGSFWGLKEVTAIQADLSPQGARVSVAPVHKFKLFLASMSAAVTIQSGVILILLGYLNFSLGIEFGDQWAYLLLTCFMGTLTGVTFGTMISAIVKKSEGVKIAIMIVFTNSMSFLAGMMYDKMKYIVHQNVPILSYLNPVNMISDAFYALYYYNTYTQFYRDILILLGFSIGFSLITYVVLRRQKYGSV